MRTVVDKYLLEKIENYEERYLYMDQLWQLLLRPNEGLVLMQRFLELLVADLQKVVENREAGNQRLEFEDHLEIRNCHGQHDP